MAQQKAAWAYAGSGWNDAAATQVEPAATEAPAQGHELDFPDAAPSVVDAETLVVKPVKNIKPVLVIFKGQEEPHYFISRCVFALEGRVYSRGFREHLPLATQLHAT